MEIVGQGIVFRGKKGTDHASCAFPGIAVLPAGRWVCGFRAAPTKKGTAGQHALIAISDDEGRTWPKIINPFIPMLVDRQPGLFRAAYPTALGGNKALAALCWVDHSDPALPFFNEETEGLLDTRIFLSLSKDGGETWTAPRLIETPPFKSPTPLTGPVLVLPDGEWALQFELNKHYYDPEPWRHASIMIFSFDLGQSWPHHTIAGRDPANRVFYWDQRPAVLEDGTLLDVFWTYDRTAADYLNIHARKSTSCGRSWSDIWDTDVAGQPAQPVSFPDGRIAMVYVDRTAAPAIKLRVSADGGKTWPAETEMTLYQPEVIRTQLMNSHCERPSGAKQSDPQGRHEASEGSRGDLIGSHEIATSLHSSRRLRRIASVASLLRNDTLFDALALTPPSGKKSSVQDAWSEMEKFSLGLPATARLPNGDLLVVFYAGPEPDLTDIRWLRLHPR